MPLRLLRRLVSKAPVLAFADFDKPFLLKTDTSELGLGAVLSQKQTDSWYHLVAYASRSLTIHEFNDHSKKHEFLALKWVIAKQFQEYLHWKLFTVRTDSSPLNDIMTTPNLDATQHQWVESLPRFTFSTEYQKEKDNAATYALNWVTLKLDTETMKSILDGITVGLTQRVDAQDPAVVKADEEIHKQVKETANLALAAQAHVNLHVTDWVTAQQEDPIL